MVTLIQMHPVTPNGKYRRVSLRNHGFAPAELVEAVCEELERLTLLAEAKLHEQTACERLAAWLISGNVAMYADRLKNLDEGKSEADPC